MFRKIYTDAVDDIEINKELKAALIKKASEASVPSVKKAPQKRRIYMISGFAAAAAAVALSIIALDGTNIADNSDKLVKNDTSIQIKNDTTKLTQQEETTEKNGDEEIAAIQKGKNAISENRKEKSEPRIEKNAEKVQKSEAAADTNAVSEQYSEQVVAIEKPSEPIIALEESAEEAKESAKSDLMAEKAQTDNFSIASSSDASENSEEISNKSGGAMVMALNGTTDTMTLSEYAEYIGADIEKALALPNDMKSETGKTVYISKDEDNNIVCDDCCFYYTGENGRYVSVITSKNTQYASDMLSSDTFDKKNVKNLKWAVTENEEYQTAVTVKAGVSFTVDSYKLTNSEQEKILISISEIEIK